jgi:hypothetical protein
MAHGAFGRRRLTAALLLLALAAAPASAGPVLSGPGAFAFSGTLAADNDVRFHGFSIAGTPLDVVIESFSYAGGTLADGSTVGRGGFDPVLSLFDAAGFLLARGADNPLRPDPGGSGNAYDDILRLRLAPGDYSIAVSQWDNTPPAQLDPLAPLTGFLHEFAPNFTAFFCPDGTGSFCDSQYDRRSADYTVQVSATLAAVPLPPALALLAAAFAALGATRLGRR